MSRQRNGFLPTYRFHKARGCAIVTIDGHDHYLGPFGSPSSKQKDAALIRAWQLRQEQPSLSRFRRTSSELEPEEGSASFPSSWPIRQTHSSTYDRVRNVRQAKGLKQLLIHYPA
jgi:hypothetical protein